MNRQPLTLLLALTLVGCAQAAPMAPAPAPVAAAAAPAVPSQAASASEVTTVTATGTINPLGSDGRALLAVVSPWTSADIHRVVLTLSTGGSTVATVPVVQADLTNQVSFTNLKKATTYSILARAYNTSDTTAPIDNSTVSLASCTTTFTTTNDAAVSIGNIALQLTNKTFAGAGTSSLTIGTGNVVNSGVTEAMAVVPRIFNITTFGGTGAIHSYNVSQENGPATSAPMTPNAMCFDGSGNLYYTDQEQHRVRKITPGGLITLVAGNGTYNFAGDGGLAINASFQNPSGIAVNNAGDIFISESGSHRVRKVDGTTGNISTYAGSSLINDYAGDGGQATSAKLAGPKGLALDSAGNLYIADMINQCIRKVDATTKVITTVAGTGGTFGGSGDGGAATLAQLTNPNGVAVNSAGDIFIADTGNVRIRKVDKVSGNISTYAGMFGGGGFNPAHDNVAATATQLNYPKGIALDTAGNLYIADTDNHVIRKVSTSGTLTRVAGTNVGGYLAAEDGNPAVNAKIQYPTAVAINSAGALFIADTDNRRVRKVN